jgi:uncharacterized protein YbcI
LPIELVQDPSGRAAAISTTITRLHREFYGRGATSSHTVIQRDYVIAFLEDIYTSGERTLLAAGNEQTVRDTRQAFHEAMRARFSAAVEEIMGRKVIAFMSQVHVDPDLSADIFVLEPENGNGNLIEIHPS